MDKHFPQKYGKEMPPWETSPRETPPLRHPLGRRSLRRCLLCVFSSLQCFQTSDMWTADKEQETHSLGQNKMLAHGGWAGTANQDYSEWTQQKSGSERDEKRRPGHTGPKNTLLKRQLCWMPSCQPCSRKTQREAAWSYVQRQGG